MEKEKIQKKNSQISSAWKKIAPYKWVISIVVVLLLVLGGIGVYKSSQNSSPTPTSSKITKVEKKEEPKEKIIKKKTNAVTIQVKENTKDE